MTSLSSAVKGVVDFTINMGMVAFGLGKTTAGIAINAVRIGTAVYSLKNLYEDWTNLQKEPETSTTKKIMVLINGASPCLNIASVLLSLYNRGFEQRHFHVLAANKKILEELWPCPNLNSAFTDPMNIGFEEKYTHAVEEWRKHLVWKYPFDLPPENQLKDELQKWLARSPVFRAVALVNIQQAVKSYQGINAVFEKLHWASLAIGLVKHFGRKGLSSQEELLSLVIDKAYNILQFHSNAHCDYNLSRTPLVEMCLNYFFSPAYYFTELTGGLKFLGLPNLKEILNELFLCARDSFHLPIRSFDHPPIQIGRFNLTRFVLPSDASDPSLSYPKIPEKFYNQEPFFLYLCSLEKTPLTKALFIVEKDASFLLRKGNINSLYFRNQKN